MSTGVGSKEAQQALYKFIQGCLPDKYLDQEEEQEIISKGESLGIWKGQTEAMINHSCRKMSCTRETEIAFLLKVMLEEMTKDDGVIDKGEFDHCIGFAVALRMPRKNALRHCIAMVRQNGWETKAEGRFAKRDWLSEYEQST